MLKSELVQNPLQIAHFWGRERRLVNPKYGMPYPWKQGGNMARKRLTMKKIKEVLRLKYEAGLSSRAIAGACKISNSTVGKYLKRTEAAGMGWPLEEIGEGELMKKMFPEIQAEKPEPRYPMPDWEMIKKEQRKKGVSEGIPILPVL
jgi:hypothetical protein